MKLAMDKFLKGSHKLGCHGTHFAMSNRSTIDRNHRDHFRGASGQKTLIRNKKIVPCQGRFMSDDTKHFR